MNSCVVALSFALATFPYEYPEMLNHQREIAARSVRVEVEGARCSGVLIDAHTVRTAGHCFRYGTRVRAVLNGSNEVLGHDYSAVFHVPAAAVWSGATYDHAEIHSETPMTDLDRIEMVDVSAVEPGREVWLGGFGDQAGLRLLSSYIMPRWVLTMIGPVTRYDALNLRTTSVRPGDSGGGVWMIKDERLVLIGTVSMAVSDAENGLPITIVQRLRPVK